MESLFPGLFFLEFFVPTMLRIGAGAVLLLHAKSLWGVSRRGKTLAVKEAVFGLLLVVGFLTQLAAIFAALVVLGRGWWMGNEVKENWRENIVLIVALLSLLVLGAGAFAIDLPY